jgi:hypothetical protein
MKRKTAVSALRKDVALTKRYGKIGIPAVAAATRYQAARSLACGKSDGGYG